ncbi:ATP-binding protein [Maribacter sp. 2307ULW6-5]|uniref:ATP-binding protein n=1 Tax=Maribacter sp. 2307ULW6-5 TaxID=3386275 RepID=UPI0039BD31BD
MKSLHPLTTKDQKMAMHTNSQVNLNVMGMFIFVLSILHFSTAANAQINASKGVPSFTNYVIGDDNPAGQQVWNVGQDREGFIYVGTTSGLQKFDGVNWEILTNPEQDYNTNVRATYLATNGTYYYGSINDFGIVTKDSSGTSLLTSLIEFLPEEIPFNDIWSIREVKGKIYFQSRDAIFIYSPDAQDKQKSIRIWKPDTKFMYSFSLNDTFYAHQSELGLFWEKNEHLELIPGSKFLGNDRVQVLLPYKNPGEFLVGAIAGGLFHFNGTDFKPFRTEIDSLMQTRSLYKALALPDNTYAISVLGSGFFIIDQKGKALSQFTTKNSIPDQSVYAFYLDRTQNLWVGTNAGLSKIELFSPVTRFDSEEYEVGNVLSLNAYGDDLYIGTSTSILYIDHADGIIKKVQDLPNTQVFDLEADVDQLISSGPGLYKIQGNKASVIQGTESFQTVALLISKKYPGYVFLGGASGLHVLKRSPNQFGSYAYQSIGPISGVTRSVYSVVENSSGEIWAGTQSGVLYRVQIPKTASGNLDISNAIVKGYTDADGIEGLSGTARIIRGQVYTSGIEGFFYFDNALESFEKDTIFSFSDEIADINLDLNGLIGNQFGDVTLLFKGEKRLAKLQPDGSYIISEYPFNLITANFTGAGYTEPSGVFWFGTDEGLLRLDPNMEYKTDHVNTLYFRVVKSADSLLTLPQYHGDATPELLYSNNNISFNYVSPFFVKENRIQYQTFLEGLDEDWGEWGSKTSREFTSLPFGTYTFRVKAKNTFGILSEEIAYAFEVLPPWYATWWAYLLYLLGLGFIVYGLVKMQTKSVLAKEKARNQEKELAQAKEIEKAYENLKATQSQLIQSEKMASLGELTAGIAHEIQNPLNFVNNFSEVSNELVDEMNEELEKGDIEEAKAIAKDIKQNLEKINHHGKRADNIVKGMLQHSRSSSGVKEPTDINALADEYLRLAYHGLRAKDKSFNAELVTDFDASIGRVKVIPQDLGRVILNLITNAFYASKERKQAAMDKAFKPKVTVSTKKTKTGIQISIADNGKGIPKQILDKIFQPFFTTKPTGQGTGLGLSMSYDIITKGHKGKLSVDTKENEGTTFIILLPNDTNTN